MRTLTFVHPVTASVNFPFAAHFFHVGPLVRREVDEGVVRQPQLLENVQDLPCREENSPWETSSIFPKEREPGCPRGRDCLWLRAGRRHSCVRRSPWLSSWSTG